MYKRQVLGIGDASYESLPFYTKIALTEYYKVNSLEDYEEVYRACAYSVSYTHLLSIEKALLLILRFLF